MRWQWPLVLRQLASWMDSRSDHKVAPVPGPWSSLGHQLLGTMCHRDAYCLAKGTKNGLARKAGSWPAPQGQERASGLWEKAHGAEAQHPPRTGRHSAH